MGQDPHFRMRWAERQVLGIVIDAFGPEADGYLSISERSIADIQRSSLHEVLKIPVGSARGVAHAGSGHCRRRVQR